MSGQKDMEEVNEISVNGTKSVSNQFFDADESFWPYMAVLLAIVILSLWTLRSAFDFIYSTLIIICYSIVCLVSTRFKMREISLESGHDSLKFTFIRSGVSWKTMVQVLSGAAIPILLPWFVLSSSIPNSSALADFLMLIAMIIYIGLVPLAPSLASISRISLLKTMVIAEYDQATSTFLDFQIVVNPLDGHWFEIRNNPDFISHVEDLVSEFISSQIAK